MTFLFGDSSPSELRIDYIELLRDALDFSVQLLLADERMRRGLSRREEAQRAADAETTRLTGLGATVSRAVEAVDVGAAESATATCAHNLLLRASEIVRAANERVQTQVVAEAARAEEEARRDRERCVEALQQFLRRHDLPNMTSDLRLQQQGGTAYVARLYVRGLTDLQAVLDLEIPSSHVLAHVIRVEKLVERLEVHAPEAGGWLRKEVKLRPQRLDKEHVTAVVVGAHETTIHLRSSADGSGVGFDLIFKEESPRVVLRRIGEATELPPFDLDDTDSAKVIELRNALLAAATELIKLRKSLIEAALAGTPLYDHKDPRVIVERLVAEMAPVVREIAKRSLTKTELVLKRQTGDGRREEIFVSRADLQNRLRPLGEGSRVLFKPLELGDPPANGAAQGAANGTADGIADVSSPSLAPPVAIAKGKSEAATASSAATAASSAAAKSARAKSSSLFAEALEPPSDPSIELKIEGKLDKDTKSTTTSSARTVEPGKIGPPPRATQEESIPIDDSLDRLLVSDAARPKSKS